MVVAVDVPAAPVPALPLPWIRAPSVVVPPAGAPAAGAVPVVQAAALDGPAVRKTIPSAAVSPPAVSATDQVTVAPEALFWTCSHPLRDVSGPVRVPVVTCVRRSLQVGRLVGVRTSRLETVG